MKNFISFLFLSLFVLSCFAQPAGLNFKVGAIKTDNKKNAILVGVSYARSLDSIWGAQEMFLSGKNSIFTLNPQIKIETGTEDAFSSIEAKMTGLFMSFKTKELKDDNGNVFAIIPDLDKGLQTFPVSIGAETNNTFSTINGIVEAGWVPWYQSETSKTPDLLKHTKFGIFVQGGYKFKGDSAGSKPLGGNVDQSAERLNTTLLRAKGLFTVDTKKLVQVQGLNVGLVGNAEAWYDFVNSKVYHRLQGIARFYLSDAQYFDLEYSKGSGAPNFNQGDQWGVGVTLAF